MSVATRVVRAGRSAVLVEGELTAGGRAVLQSRTWLTRRTDGSPVSDQEWVLLESRTRLSAGGWGLATSTLHDGLGAVGASAQTLVVQALP